MEATVAGSARIREDSAPATGELVFPAGSPDGAEAGIVVPITNDRRHESVEELTVSLTATLGLITDAPGLEGRGVAPDEVLVPSAEDLAANRDVVLTRAAALAGLEIAEGETLSFLPCEWPTR